MDTLPYGIRRELTVSFEVALDQTRKALAEEGFGTLFEIDLKETLNEKLSVDFQRYTILGACNPSLALQALKEEIDIGLLLPCNLIVYEDGSTVVVAAIDAVKMMSVVGNKEIRKTAERVDEKLRRAIAALRS